MKHKQDDEKTWGVSTCDTHVEVVVFNRKTHQAIHMQNDESQGTRHVTSEELNHIAFMLCEMLNKGKLPDWEQFSKLRRILDNVKDALADFN